MWINITLETDAAHADALSDALMDAGAISVSVEDALAGTALETPQFGEPGEMSSLPQTPLWAESRVTALFMSPAEPGTVSPDMSPAEPGTVSPDMSPATDLIERVTRAAQQAGLNKLPELQLTEVAEQDWVRLTQSQFEPIRINSRLWIVPSWHTAPDPAAINLVLDPGLAFGTGSHPTTWLCLQWLTETVTGSPGTQLSLLDYGCGSGILAIAAARLGVAKVMGVDIDDNALVAARDNAAMNSVTLTLGHSREPLHEQFDIVVANILTNPLCALAPALASRVAPGGRLALSGILAEQAQQVIDAYAPYLTLRVGATQDGWIRLENLPC